MRRGTIVLPQILPRQQYYHQHQCCSLGRRWLLCVPPQTTTKFGDTTKMTMSFANNNTAVRFFGGQERGKGNTMDELYMDIWCSSDRKKIRYSTEKVKKKKPKGSGKVKKVIPPLKSIEEELAIIEDRVAKMEREHLGRSRGRQAVKEMVRAEKINKKATTAMGKLFGNEWLYTLHALRNGYRHINDMKKVALAESLLGKGTKVKISLRDVKTILKEQFRHGRSGLFDNYQRLHEERVREIKQIEINREKNMARRQELEEAGLDYDQVKKEERARIRARIQEQKDARAKQKKAERLARPQAQAQANQVWP
jgi:hypothetical protein